MRILHLITSLKIGGAEQALFNYLKSANNTTHEHHVAYLHPGPLVQSIADLGIPTYRLRGFLCTYDPVMLYRLCDLIKKIQPDIIHSSLWSSNILGRFLAKFYKIPLVSDLHGSCLHEGRLRNFFDALTLPLSGAVVAVCDEVKNDYHKKIIGKSSHSYPSKEFMPAITVIKNGIDVVDLRQKAFTKPLSRQQLGFADTDFVIGTVGRLEWIKGYDLLIQAMDMLVNSTYYSKTYHTNLKLCFVGDGSEKAHLERYVRHFGLEKHVFFAGSRTDAYRFYPLFNCFTLSSHSEGLSIALLEALAFGLPVVMTHHKQTHEVITNGLNGILVHRRNQASLAQAFDQLFKNTALRESMSNANYQLALEHYDIKRVVQEYDKIFVTTRKQWGLHNHTTPS